MVDSRVGISPFKLKYIYLPLDFLGRAKLEFATFDPVVAEKH